MFQWVLKKIIGSKNQRELKKIGPVVEQINALEEALQKQDESVLRDKTTAWKDHLSRYSEDIELFARRKLESLEDSQLSEILDSWATRFDRLADEFSKVRDLADTSSTDKEAKIDSILTCQEAFGEIRGAFKKSRAAYLDEILPEAFAVVKNAARRLCGTSWNVCDHPVEWQMVHFDVQLIGGMCLHKGNIAEMATGEGKTLVATLPTYLNALTGLGVHVITVNDYLARRDSEWMGHLFAYLGLTTGTIQNGQHGENRRAQYECDITYGTASEFGFDYLRDNGMATSSAAQVQRTHYYALIDEVDSVLIDEARTPLIISGPVAHQDNQQYDTFKPLIEKLVRKQTQLCNQLVADSKKLLEEGKDYEAGVALFKVKLGQPLNRGLIRAMENPDLRRLIEKSELDFYKDQQKTALFELKEELYFNLDEKASDADLTDKGRNFLSPDDPESFILPDLATDFSAIDGDESLNDKQRTDAKQKLQDYMATQAARMHTISQLLRAYCNYERDVHYMVADNKVVILDENTGRGMAGRRWSDGLHQAVEAKEGVNIEAETQTYATITIQNYFRLYEKLSGMTGTAETEAAEFHDIYKLDVRVIPTNRPVAREDFNDKIYKTQREKINAVISLIADRHAKGQPILLGTASVESSEVLSRMLKRAKITHKVLSAKYHAQEAEIVQRAGLKGAVTVATNMAGRGTDIKLGDGVRELGGLLVLGTERHQSRRIDRQLRGRCARQGDPGESVFFVSFEDELMRKFGAAERMTRMMDRFGLEEGQELEHPWLNKSVENAQKKVEQRNYTSRKRILDYDDVMNQQRGVVYGYRNEVLKTEDPHALVMEVIEDGLPAKLSVFTDPETGEPDHAEQLNWVNTTFPLGLRPEEAKLETRSEEDNIEYLIEKVRQAYELKVSHESPDELEGLERYVILRAIDNLWQEHLYNMDGIREAIGLRSHAQKDPLVEYKTEAYQVFLELMDNIKGEVLSGLFRTTSNPEEYASFLRNLPSKLSHDTDVLSDFGGPADDGLSTSGPGSAEDQPKINIPQRREVPKVGRNEPCPCGSGKKFKACHGKAGSDAA